MIGRRKQAGCSCEKAQGFPEKQVRRGNPESRPECMNVRKRSIRTKSGGDVYKRQVLQWIGLTPQKSIGMKKRGRSNIRSRKDAESIRSLLSGMEIDVYKRQVLIRIIPLIRPPIIWNVILISWNSFPFPIMKRASLLKSRFSSKRIMRGLMIPKIITCMTT